MIVLVALLVCLIPTTIGALLSAIGIAGMDRLVQHNVLAMSGRAVEAAGDVNTLLLDKTGTITLGNRQATEFLPVGGVTPDELADAAQLSSLADETPEGRSIVVLAKTAYGLRERSPGELTDGAVRRRSPPRPGCAGVDLAGRSADPQGRGRPRSSPGCASSGGRATGDGRRTSSTPSPPPAARRWSSPSAPTGTPGRSASSTSRTWSRRACASGSTRCAGWASAP